jgi:hypothetical protein
MDNLDWCLRILEFVGSFTWVPFLIGTVILWLLGIAKQKRLANVNLRSDLKFSLQTYKRALIEHPFLFSSYVLCAAASTIAGRVDSLAAKTAEWTFIAAIVVLMVAILCVLFKASVPDTEPRPSTRLPLATLVGVEILFDIGFLFLLLFFIFPAIWWAVRSCLSLPVACLESLSIRQSIKRSFALTKGRFWEVSSYLTPAYILVSAIPLSIAESVKFVIDSSGVIRAQGALSPIGLSLSGIEFAMSIGAVLSYYLIAPLLVRVYFQLADSTSASTTTVS